MTAYTLHCFPESGGCYKVALMLNCLEVDWRPSFVNYFDGITRGPEFKSSLNDMGEVPVLEFEGRKLTQSGAILTHLAERHGRFGSENVDERFEMLRWLLFDNHKFTSYFATYRFLRSFTPTPPHPAVLDFLKWRIESAFGIVEKHLLARDFVIGGRPTIVDFSMVGYLFFPAAETGFELSVTHPNIAAWLSRISSVKGWRPPYELLPGPRYGR